MFIGFARLPAGGGSHQRTRLGNQAERLILAFYSRFTRARGQRREPRHGRPICRRQTRLRGEIPEPSGGFNVKTGLARVPPGSNAAVLLVFSTVASTILRCGGSLGPR